MVGPIKRPPSMPNERLLLRADLRMTLRARIGGPLASSKRS
jgi:hypothetical protein